MHEVALKPLCYIHRVKSINVKPARCLRQTKGHVRIIERIELTQEVLDWLTSNTRSGWKLLMKTKSLCFKDKDEAFHFRMRW